MQPKSLKSEIAILLSLFAVLSVIVILVTGSSVFVDIAGTTTLLERVMILIPFIIGAGFVVLVSRIVQAELNNK